MKTKNSMILNVKVNNQTIQRIDNNIPIEKSQDYLWVNFTFSDDWQDLTKVAYFQYGDEFPYKVDIIDDTCLVPNEVILYGITQLWVLGKSETSGVQVPTNKIGISIGKTGVLRGDDPYLLNIDSTTLETVKKGNVTFLEIPNSYGVKLTLDENGIIKLLGRDDLVLSEIDLHTENIIKAITYKSEENALVFEFDNAPNISVPMGDIFKVENYFTKDEVSEIESNLITQINNKVDKESLNELQQNIEENITKKIDSIEDTLETKANKDEVEQLDNTFTELSTDIKDVLNEINGGGTFEPYDELLALINNKADKNSLEALREEVNKKAGQAELDQLASDIDTNVNAKLTQIENTIGDINSLLEEVNTLLDDVNGEVV